MAKFDTFKQRKLQRGDETLSEIEYKGYIIQLRAYKLSGITGRIIKEVEPGKRKKLRERRYNFKNPVDFGNELKKYIDNFEINLLKKLGS